MPATATMEDANAVFEIVLDATNMLNWCATGEPALETVLSWAGSMALSHQVLPVRVT